ncbi:hypothetical protein B484DRAFT_451190 [Ochromonadaceae sp. CCMP2298]|nr:hypothetical protein B484DRAFT_451190 [Ochromonadaceae sp. CCMP2298]
MSLFFKSFPIHVNPCYSLAIVLVMAYVPHLTKKALLAKKLKEAGKQYTTANSRGLSSLMVDDTPQGMRIANIMGCHQNGLEAFAYYSVAVLASMVVGLESKVLSGFAGFFILIRAMYTFVYMSKFNGAPRTLLFFASGFSCMGLMVLAGNKYSA